MNKNMKVIRFNEKGHCQFVYFDWRRFRFKTSCWAENVCKLLGNTNDKPRKFIGVYKPSNT